MAWRRFFKSLFVQSLLMGMLVWAGCGSLSPSQEPEAVSSCDLSESLAADTAAPGAELSPLPVSTLPLEATAAPATSRIAPSKRPEPGNRTWRKEPPRNRKSLSGRPLEFTTHGYGAEAILILGGIHGSEPASTMLVEKLAPFLNVHPYQIRGKRIIVAPAVNPDGLALNQRTNNNGIDLNRNFCTRNRKPGKRSGYEPLSEPEAVFIADLILHYRPTRILSVHQPLACVDWDGPGRELARIVSEACGLPMKKLGALPGSLGSYAGVELGIPIITLELPRRVEKDGPDLLWEKYGKALLEFIKADTLQNVGNGAPL